MGGPGCPSCQLPPHWLITRKDWDPYLREFVLPCRPVLIYRPELAATKSWLYQCVRPRSSRLFGCASSVGLVRMFEKELGSIVNCMRADQAFLPPMPDRIY